jgi:hypothetical protein
MEIDSTRWAAASDKLHGRGQGGWKQKEEQALATPE